MLKNRSFAFLILAIVLVAAQACNMPNAAPAAPTIDPLIAVQLTVDAALAQTQTLSAPGFTSLPTFTLEPTFTSTPFATPTSAITSTPSFSFITLSVATNCRKGPGKTFDLIDTFNPGQVIEVLGKDPSGEYWYVRSPNNQAVFCWLWGEYASGGNLGGVAMFTPPPSPTSMPSFDVSYTSTDSCIGWWVEFTLKNVGATAFKSISISVKDTVADVTLNSSSNEFTNLDGCLTAHDNSKLDVGEVAIVSSPAFVANPSGHKIKATITLCVDDNSAGQCSVKSIEFTP